MPSVKKEDRIGQKNMMLCGEEATIVAYRNALDIDVMFPDGTIAKNRNYSSFKKGLVKKRTNKGALESERLGERRTMSNGMSATIIRYSNAFDIDIRFDDGYIAKKVSYRNFKRGLVAHAPSRKCNTCPGEKRMMNCGLYATVTTYYDRKINVVFEDGAEVKGRKYERFKVGQIAHPKLGLKKSNKDFYGFKATYLLSNKDKVFYKCECLKCKSNYPESKEKYRFIMTPQMMIEHKESYHGKKMQRPFRK